MDQKFPTVWGKCHKISGGIFLTHAVYFVVCCCDLLTGSRIGTMQGLLLSGILCKYLGWESVFYVFGKNCLSWITSLTFVKGVSIAYDAEPCVSYTLELSVHPSVRLSVPVTRWHCIKTMQAKITKSPGFGVKSSSRNSKGFTLNEGSK